VSDMISSRADRTRHYSSGGVSLSRPAAWLSVACR
jgi:hypothetical protein